MPDDPQRPDQPARGDLPPEQPPPPPDATATLPAEPEPVPADDRPSRTRRVASHRATPIVAAGLAGLIIGGGTMALIAYAGGDDDRDHHRPAFVMRDGDGPRWEERGPMKFKMVPPGLREERLDDMRDRLRERLENMPIPEHHHDKDGNIVPGPAPEPEGRGGN